MHCNNKISIFQLPQLQDHNYFLNSFNNVDIFRVLNYVPQQRAG